MIEQLINTPDQTEKVRDKVAEILALNTKEQQRLAYEAGALDPKQWAFSVYVEASHPWQWVTNQEPIVNVWWDTSSLQPAAGGSVGRKRYQVDFNLDIYAAASGEDDPTGGHEPAARAATLTAQRITRLVRNLLSADRYIYLDLRGVVTSSRVNRITMLQPPQDNRNAFAVGAARLVLTVELYEEAPAVQPVGLAAVDACLKIGPSGLVEVPLTFEYD